MSQNRQNGNGTENVSVIRAEGLPPEAVAVLCGTIADRAERATECASKFRRYLMGLGGNIGSYVGTDSEGTPDPVSVYDFAARFGSLGYSCIPGWTPSAAHAEEHFAAAAVFYMCEKTESYQCTFATMCALAEEAENDIQEFASRIYSSGSTLAVRSFAKFLVCIGDGGLPDSESTEGLTEYTETIAGLIAMSEGEETEESAGAADPSGAAEERWKKAMSRAEDDEDAYEAADMAGFSAGPPDADAGFPDI